MKPRLRHSKELGVLSLGLCSPLGLTTRRTQVEMAAGTVRFFQTQVQGLAGDSVRASMLTLLEPDLSRTERMASMAATALHDCLREMGHEYERLPLLLALPEAGVGPQVDEEFLRKALQQAAGSVCLEVPAGGMLREGRAAFFRALDGAANLLESRQASRVLVGAVDSWCDTSSLRYLADAGRTIGPARRDGILPGEGAGFALVALPADCGRDTPRHGWVTSRALAKERHHFLRRQPNLAEGLTSAFHQIRHHSVAGMRRVDEVVSCQTGEAFWAHEFDKAYLRNAPLMPEPLVVNLVAEALGDTGAAAGVLGLGYAQYRASRLEPAHGQVSRVLLYGCSDDGLVGACIVESGE